MTRQIRRETGQPPHGAALRDAEDRHLIALLLGPEAAGQVEHVPVAMLLDAHDRHLAEFGLSAIAQGRLQAAAELARRFQPATEPPVSLERPRQFLTHLAQIRVQPVEHLGVLLLDSRLALLGDFQSIAGGALMHVGVTPREVFADAVARRAAAIVLAHNHPSDDPSPSPDDREFTRLMVRAGTIVQDPRT